MAVRVTAPGARWKRRCRADVVAHRSAWHRALACAGLELHGGGRQRPSKDRAGTGKSASSGGVVWYRR